MQAYALSHVFPTGVFLEINQGMYNHQTNYSYFSHRVFSNELKETCRSQDGLDQRGSVIILYLISSKHPLQLRP